MVNRKQAINEISELSNRHILHSAAHLAVDEPEQALTSANTALEAAERLGLYDLESKSHFYRGLCFMRLRRWREASMALTRAASRHPWGMQVEDLKRRCEEMRVVNGGNDG